MSGVFIVLEGPDGSGTTTQSKMLAEALIHEGKNVLLTCEPTDGPIGSFIRTALRTGEMPGDALQLLFTADRSWHVNSVIQPALDQGKTVISDRYMLSTILYGSALGIATEWLETLNSNFIRPDLQFIALPPFDICYQRVKRRPLTDIMEEESIMKRVHKQYSDYAKTHSEFFIIDTSGDRIQTHHQLLALVKQSCYK